MTYRGFATALGIAIMGCLGAGLRLEGAEAEGGAPKVTSIQQYWNLTSEQKAAPVPFDMVCDVTFFDPVWQILFVQDQSGAGAYVPYGSNPYPFKSGERIHATGSFLPPNADISFVHATVVPLGPSKAVPYLAVGKITHFGELLNRFVTLDAFVDSYRMFDTIHLELTLSVEGRTIFAWLPMGPGAPLPDLRDAVVRIEGVYNPKLGPDGKTQSIEIMIPEPRFVTVLDRLSEDPRFKIPVIPMGQLPLKGRDQLVRVVGQVKRQDPGHLLRIRDETGQVDVLSGQTRRCAIDDWVEAVGYPDTTGTQWQLTDGLFRTTGTLSTTVLPAAGDTLRLSARVLELSLKDAAQGHPVWLTGVITWSCREAPFFFIQDSSGGICVMRGGVRTTLMVPGRNVEVHGRTALGNFAPVVIASQCEKVSELALPQAEEITLERAMTGDEEAKWVEMRGYLRQVRHEAPWNVMEIATSSGDFTAALPESEDVSGWVGSVVRLHGVCTAVTNDRRKLTGIRLWLSTAADLQVESAAPSKPFDLPLTSLSELGQFNTIHAADRRLHVAGIVIHHSPGHLIHIVDGDESLLIYARGTEPLKPGDRIEAVGFTGRSGGRMTLRESVYRRTGSGPEPIPQRLQALGVHDLDWDGRLVSVEGTLLDVGEGSDQVTLTVQSGSTLFEAALDRPLAAGLAASLVPASRLSLVGVYEIKHDESGQPVGFDVRLRSARDVTVLKAPSWLTRDRVLAIATVLVLAVLLFIAWIGALRRTVSRQTLQIREQVLREAQLQAELSRAGKLESLGLLAGGLAHDFNNLLTVVMGNLSLVRMDPQLSPDTATSLVEAEKAMVRARDLTQQLLTFSKGGSPIRSAVSLSDVVKEVAEFALRGSNARCDFDFADNLWTANVDKGQIGQVVQNIVINAAQAMPEGGVVGVTLQNTIVGDEFGKVLSPGRYVMLSVRDHGKGIGEKDLERIFDPYFTTKRQGSGLGLATVYSIVKKHLGHISVQSAPGFGSIFRIWLPAVDDSAVPAEGAAPHPAAPTENSEHVRVLFMDDEESIRRLGDSILRRSGHDVTLVSDGEAAIEAFKKAELEGRPYSLVILDLTIPGGMGGRQALEEIRKVAPGIKAIVSSGYSNDLVLSHYQACGFRGMIAKPYDVTAFSTTVARVLAGEQL